MSLLLEENCNRVRLPVIAPPRCVLDPHYMRSRLQHLLSIMYYSVQDQDPVTTQHQGSGANHNVDSPDVRSTFRIIVEIVRGARLLRCWSSSKVDVPSMTSSTQPKSRSLAALTSNKYEEAERFWVRQSLLSNGLFELHREHRQVTRNTIVSMIPNKSKKRYSA